MTDHDQARADYEEGRADHHAMLTDLGGSHTWADLDLLIDCIVDTVAELMDNLNDRELTYVTERIRDGIDNHVYDTLAR